MAGVNGRTPIRLARNVSSSDKREEIILDPKIERNLGDMRIRGLSKMVDLLLKYGANASIADNDGKTPYITRFTKRQTIDRNSKNLP